VLVWGQRQC